MVAGKNVSPALTRAAPAPKLPPLRTLRVRRPDGLKENPCMSAMISVLGCWASHGYTSKGCAALEASLRACVDTPRPTADDKNRINSQLARLYPKMKPPMKRK